MGADRTSIASVERVLTEQEWEEGELRLGRREAEVLGLPEHSCELSVQISGNAEVADWDARARRIRGEAIADYLMFTGRAGEIVRHTLESDVLHVALLPREETTLASGRNGVIGVASKDDAAGQDMASDRQQLRRRRRRRSSDRFKLPARREYEWHGEVGVLKASLEGLRKAINGKGWDDPKTFALRMRGEKLAAVSGFEELIAADLAKVDQMPHQYSAAMKVLARMQGRAILADEVGLGKTIEAGLVLKELITRGMATRFLVVCPAPLREQWAEELDEKFGLDSRVVWAGSEGLSRGNLIMSTELARRKRAQIVKQKWDVVIVDEAHRGAGGAANREMLSGLGRSARFLLFLTATPVQNSLLDLYHLVENLRPGTFADEPDFKRRYCKSNDDKDPSDPEALRELVSNVMVRTTRGQAGLDRVTRHVNDCPVVLSPAEKQNYDRLLDLLRRLPVEQGDQLRRQAWARRLVLSPRALALSLIRTNRLTGDLLADAHRIADEALVDAVTSRQQTLIDLVGAWVRDPDKGKVVVFSSQKDVAEDLIRLLGESGLRAVPYFGSQDARRRSLKSFRERAQVLVATDAGAEGLNLQFANCVVNYDLPWNPMKIEQRIGRVDRLNQHRDVHVANFYSPGTVEDRVLRVLRDKLRMFELLFGQVTLVLGEFDDGDGRSFETQIADAIFGKRSVAKAFDELDAAAKAARKRADQQFGAQQNLSDWIGGAWDTSHRQGLTRSGDSTLLPEQVEASRERQRELTSFVQDFLSHLGAKVVREVETSIGDGADVGIFLTADLPRKLEEAFDTDRLHVAFHPSGLSQHPAAELCAVGSDLFEEMVDHLREAGDLLIKVPRFDRQDDDPLLGSTKDLEYAGRRILGSTTWDVEGTWLARIGGETGATKLLHVPGDPQPRMKRRALTADDERPETLSAGRITKSAMKRAVQSAAADAAKVSEEAFNKQRQEFETIRSDRIDRLVALKEVLDSKRNRRERLEIENRISNLRSLIESTEEPTQRTLEARLELLGLSILGGPTIRMVEQWRTRSDEIIELPIEYSVIDDTYVADLGDDGVEIATVAACDAGHVVDRRSRRECPECRVMHCDACEGAEYRLCPGCLRSVCPTCTSPRGLCSVCSTPERVDELDRDGLAAFRLARGRTLLIGRRVALLESEPVVGADRTDRRLVEAARALGLGPDCGLRGDLELPPTDGDGRVRIELETATVLEIVEDGSADGEVDSAILERVYGQVDEVSEDESNGLVDLVTRLRADLHLPPIGIIARAVGSRTSILLTESGPQLEVVERGIDGDVDVRVGPLDWQKRGAPRTSVRAVVAECEVGRTRDTAVLRLERIHMSHLLRTIVDGEEVARYFVPAHVGVSLAQEMDLADFAEELHDRQGRHLVWSHADSCPEPTGSDRAELLARDVSPFDACSERPGRRPLEPSDLCAQSTSREPSSERATMRVDEVSVADILRPWASEADPANPSDDVAIGRWYEVTETWRGDTDATATYRVEGGSDARSPVDGIVDFVVDRSGHFVAAEDASACPVCHLHACQNCSPDLVAAPCLACGQPACTICASQPALVDTLVSPEACVDCGLVLCASCGREQRSGRCELCCQPLCADHVGRCSGCSSLVEASREGVAALPSVLAADGHLVLIGSGSRCSTVVIAGGERLEVVSLGAAGRIERWLSPLPVEDVRHLVRLAGVVQGPTVRPVRVFEGFDAPRDVGSLGRRLVLKASLSGAGVVSSSVPCERDDDVAKLMGLLLPVGPGELDLGVIEQSMELGPVLDGVLVGRDVPAATSVVIRIEPTFVDLRVDSVRGLLLETISSSGRTSELVVLDAVSPTAVLDWRVETKPFGHGVEVAVSAPDGSVVEVRRVGESQEALVEGLELERLRRDYGLPDGPMLAGRLGAAAGIPWRDWPVGVEYVVGSRLVTGRSLQGQTPLSVRDLPPGISSSAQADDDGPPGFVVEPQVVEQLLVGTSEPFSVDVEHEFVVEWPSSRSGPPYTTSTVGDSVPSPPALTTPEEASWDFTIDRAGHLVGDGHTTPCPVCGAVSCDACVEPEVVAECTTCTQPACGTCRKSNSRHDTKPNRTCVDCGLVLCASCGREQRSVVCEICKALVCGNCSEGSRCGACAALEQVDSTVAPSGLHATGHVVHRGVNGRSAVWLVRGGRRDELIRLERGEITAWRDYSGLPPEQWFVHYAASLDSPVSGVVVRDRDMTGPHAIPELLLSESVTRHAQLFAPGGASIIDHVAVEGDVFVAVGGAIADTFPKHVVHHLPDERPPAPSESVDGSEASIVVSPITERVTLATEGIVAATYSGDELLAVVRHAFSKPPAEQDDVPALRRLGASVALAEGEGCRALRATLGPLVIVSSDPGDPTHWIRLDAGGEDPRAVVVGQALLGVPAEVRVARASDCSNLTFVTVRNGTLIDRSTRLVADRVDAPSQILSIDEAMRLLGIPFADELAAGRPLAMGPKEPPADRVSLDVEVGVQVVETWSTSAGDIVLEYAVAPGAAYAKEIAFDTGSLCHEFLVDRSAHLVESAKECQYCNQLSCSKCVTSVQPCALCGLDRCDSCGGTHGRLALCRACSALSASGAIGDRLRRVLGNHKVSGSDEVHSIEFHWNSRAAWLKVGRHGGTPNRVDLTSDQVRLLNELTTE